MQNLRFASLLLIVVFLVGESSVHALLDEDIIKCKVCDRAIAHIWNQGINLRNHCRHTKEKDDRCDLSNLHRDGIVELTQGACESLPKTHQALIHSEFDLVVRDNPNHDEEVSQAITSACVRWIHDEHTVEEVARMIFANLDAGKRTKVILHKIQEYYCDAACRAPGTVYDASYSPEEEAQSVDL